MDDLISRQAAIEALKRAEALTKAFGYHNVIETIRDLPTAEKRGKWEIDVDCEYDVFDIDGERTWATKVTCSECGFAMRFIEFIEGHEVFNYCPNCGARMEE